MIEDNSTFSKMVDELVKLSEFDTELADGIKWIDNNPKIPGDTFYDKVFTVLYKHEVNEKARKWINDKSL